MSRHFVRAPTDFYAFIPILSAGYSQWSSAIVGELEYTDPLSMRSLHIIGSYLEHANSTQTRKA